jgi:hypothetical protein
MTRPHDPKILGGVRRAFDEKNGLVERKHHHHHHHHHHQQQRQQEEWILLVPKQGPVAVVEGGKAGRREGGKVTCIARGLTMA